MKKFFYLMSLCLCMFMGVAVLTSCGDDDDDLDIKAGIVEKGNTMTLTVSNSYYTETMTATFNEQDECIKFITKEIYKSKDVADAAWSAYKSEYDEEEIAKYFKKDGKTITIDETEDYKFETRATIKQYFEAIQQEFDKM